MSATGRGGSVCGLPSHSGSTLIEVLSVVAIVGLLASLAPTSLRYAANRATTARILSDVETIGQAARRFRDETGTYPASAAWAKVPAELVDRLPGLSFENDEIRYMWWAPGGYRGVLVYTLGDPGVLQMVTDIHTGRDFSWGQFAYLVIDHERDQASQ